MCEEKFNIEKQQLLSDFQPLGSAWALFACLISHGPDWDGMSQLFCISVLRKLSVFWQPRLEKQQMMLVMREDFQSVFQGLLNIHIHPLLICATFRVS